MKSKKIIAILCLSFMIANFVACAPKAEASQSSENNAENNSSQADNLQSTGKSANSSAFNIEGMFSSRDMDIDYDENDSILITLSDSVIESSSPNVRISGSTVTINEAGTYRLQGNLSDGQIIVEAEKTDIVQLVLEGVTVSNNTSAPIYPGFPNT